MNESIESAADTAQLRNTISLQNQAIDGLMYALKETTAELERLRKQVRELTPPSAVPTTPHARLLRALGKRMS